jgi:nitrile hydratase
MDGIHDLGGMHGFGPVEREADEPCFHADWERRVFALCGLAPFVADHGDDQFRRHIERIDPATYLTSSYYELWLRGETALLKELGVLSDDELAAGHSLRPLAPHFDIARKATADSLWDAVRGGASQAAPNATGFPHRFRVGDRIRTRAAMPYGHTRLPRYARNKPGKIIAEHGAFIVADRNSEERDVAPQMLYTIEFVARDLWGDEASVGDTVRLDAWDEYLEPLAARGADR